MSYLVSFLHNQFFLTNDDGDVYVWTVLIAAEILW